MKYRQRLLTRLFAGWVVRKGPCKQGLEERRERSGGGEEWREGGEGEGGGDGERESGERVFSRVCE